MSILNKQFNGLNLLLNTGFHNKETKARSVVSVHANAQFSI